MFALAMQNRSVKLDVSSYTERGFLLVSDLIRPGVVEGAREVLSHQILATTAGSYYAFVKDPAVLASFTRTLRSAAAHLTGARWPLAPPGVTYTISVLPSDSRWQSPAPHIDHAIEGDAHRTFPPPFRVGCLIYLNDVMPHSGGTIVWPESHRQLERLAAADPRKYEYLFEINRNIQTVALAKPVEITARAGDVLFYHYLCAHSGSMNTAGETRFALNHKW